MEKKVNKMMEIALQSDLWKKATSQPQEDRYLMGSQSGITKEDLEQLAEWARNQIQPTLTDTDSEQ